MSTKLAIITAALFTALAGPVLAGDQDLATELRDSGRYVPQAGLPEWNAHNVPTNAFASAGRPMRVQAPRPTRQWVAPPANDFQLQGR